MIDQLNQLNMAAFAEKWTQDEILRLLDSPERDNFILKMKEFGYCLKVIPDTPTAFYRKLSVGVSLCDRKEKLDDGIYENAGRGLR